MSSNILLKDAVMTIRLPEEVDHFEADRLREEAGEILEERNVREVVFDFRKTGFMDSSGIGLVMGRYREMQLVGGKVRAVHVGERIRRILVMSGVARVIDVEIKIGELEERGKDDESKGGDGRKNTLEYHDTGI